MYRQRAISKAHNEGLIGRQVQVMIEKQSSESELVWIGRTAQQAPEIDGMTYVEVRAVLCRAWQDCSGPDYAGYRL